MYQTQQRREIESTVSHEVQQLSLEWQAIKEQEQKLYNERIQLENRLIELLGCRDEGSQTHKAGDFSIKIEGKMNRKLDATKWAEIRDMIPADKSPVVYKPEINIKKLRELITFDASIYRQMCRAITTTPGKPYVLISSKDKEET